MKLTGLRALSDAEIERIDAESLRILETAGVRVMDAECRAVLSSAGARVDEASERVYLPPALVNGLSPHRVLARLCEMLCEWTPVMAALNSFPTCAFPISSGP